MHMHTHTSHRYVHTHIHMHRNTHTQYIHMNTHTRKPHRHSNGRGVRTCTLKWSHAYDHHTHLHIHTHKHNARNNERELRLSDAGCKRLNFNKVCRERVSTLTTNKPIVACISVSRQKMMSVTPDNTTFSNYFTTLPSAMHKKKEEFNRSHSVNQVD